MGSTNEELEQQLPEAVEKLSNFPIEVNRLLPLLDNVENLLSDVEQSPSEKIENACSQSMKPLLAESLLRHTDADVKVAVASCISEIIRITAPEASCNDDQMKEVIRLIISSFEDLSNRSSRSYTKRISILEVVARVRLCVLMLDLECDDLIAEMFQHFLSSIRDYHQEHIFTFMETIMTLVLDESEDVSLDLLGPILASLKLDDEEYSPIARKLGESVLEKCAVKLKPFLKQAVKALGLPLDRFGKIVAAICNETNSEVDHKEENVCVEQLAEESKLTKTSSDERAQGAKGHFSEGACLEEARPEAEKYVKSVLLEVEAHSESGKKKENLAREELQSADPVSSNLDGEISDSEGKQLRRPGNKAAPGVATGWPPCTKKGRSGRGKTNTEIEDNGAAEKKQSTLAKNGEESDAENKTLVQSGNKDLTSRRRGRPLKKYGNTGTAPETKSSNNDNCNDDKASSQEKNGKRRVPGKNSTEKNEDKDSSQEDDSKRHPNGMNAKEEKDVKGSSQEDNGKRNAHGKNTRERILSKSHSKDDDKDMIMSPSSSSKSIKDEDHFEFPKVNSKRKRTSVKDKVSEDIEYGANLVGLKVKVWWPEDEFYEGVIESYDPAKKKHKVTYTDGEQETLFLKKEKWEIVDDKMTEAEANKDPDVSVRNIHGLGKELRRSSRVVKFNSRYG